MMRNKLTPTEQLILDAEKAKVDSIYGTITDYMKGIKMINWNKPIETVDGKPARLVGSIRGVNKIEYIVATDAEHKEDVWYCDMYGKNLTYSKPPVRNKPQVVELWGNVYKSSCLDYTGYEISLFNKKETAMKMGNEDRKIACIPIKFEIPDDTEKEEIE